MMGSGVLNIRAGIDTTYEDEKALSTLWHEITHNKNVVGNMPVTSLQLQFYELANEFVSRNTLPEFMYSLGGKLNHTELMDTRDNTAYNEKVKNYGYLITRVNGNKEKVLEGVIDYVVNKPVSMQEEGLINAIINSVDRELDHDSLKEAMRNARVWDSKYFISTIYKMKF
jgi:hypothetical protein